MTAQMKRFAAPELHQELERQMRLARLSPGATEAALLERVSQLMVESLDAYDLLIFDTAPTGHTLRLLTLPEAMAAWADGLLAHNHRSEELGKVLRHLTPRGSRAEVATPFDDPEHDPLQRMDRRTREVAETLLHRRRLFHRARRLLTDPAVTGFVLVLTPERLPILEMARAARTLQDFDVPISGAVINRVLPDTADGDFLRQRRAQELRHLRRIDEALEGLPAVHLEMLAEDVQGMDALHQVADRLAAAGL